MKIKFAKGTSDPPDIGVLDVLFCHSKLQFGSCVWKYSTKCCCAKVWPRVPGTRGMRIGASNAPLLGSMSGPGEGIVRKKLSERGLYAAAGLDCSTRRIERSNRADGSAKNMVARLPDCKNRSQMLFVSKSKHLLYRVIGCLENKSRTITSVSPSLYWHVTDCWALVVKFAKVATG